MSPVAPLSAGQRINRCGVRDVARPAGLLLGLGMLAGLMLLSLTFGARSVPLSATLDAFLHYDAFSVEHIIVRDYRLPRTLLGLLCGAAFGVSGALIQAATRNPLADPGILGVNAGAAFFVTLAVGLSGRHDMATHLCFALAGAMITTLVVYAIGSAGRYGSTPARLVLAGVALSAVLGGVGSSITLLKPDVFDAMRQWAVGSISGRDMTVVAAVAPLIALGLIIAVLAAHALNAMALGDDLARSLGGSMPRTRVMVVVAVTLLAGAATAAAGPIGFVGLIVPHMVRWLTGPDQRWIIGYTIVFSPILLLAADITGRLVMFPGELEAGIVTAFIGAPLLIGLARSRKARGL